MFTREGGCPVWVPAFAGTPILPGTGRGTAARRAGVEGDHPERTALKSELGNRFSRTRPGASATVSCGESPLHQLRWSPSPSRGGSAQTQNAALALASPIIVARTKGIGGPP